MKSAVYDPSLKYKQSQEWHLWFAWFPVRLKISDTNIQWVWLESVYRKGNEYISGENGGTLKIYFEYSNDLNAK